MVGGSFYTRRATLEDAALIADLGARTFRDAFAAENDPEDMDRYVAESFSVAQIEAEIEESGSIFLLGYDRDFGETRPTGYARLLGGSENACVRGPNPVELMWFRSRSRDCSMLRNLCMAERLPRHLSDMFAVPMRYRSIRWPRWRA